MSKPRKIVLGIATLCPLLYLVVFFGFIFSLIISSFAAPGQIEQNGPPIEFLILFALHFLTMILVFTLMVIYVINVFKNNKIENNKKFLWVVVLFFGSIIAMPIYWYLYIWKKPKS